MSGESLNLFEKLVGLLDQLMCLSLVDLLIIELRVIQHGDHLRCDRVALRVDGHQLILKIGICRVSSIVAFQRTRGNIQRLQSKLSNRRVDLLVSLGKLLGDTAAISQSRWHSPAFKVFEQHAAIAGVIIFESDQ